ncbi:MAG: DUF4344 domain-containing metallopeptidase [Pseudoxanthomonas sp.]
MQPRWRTILPSLAIGLAVGALAHALLTARPHARELAAAREAGRAAAEKKLADEMAALQPVAIKPVPSERPKADGTHFGYEYVPPKSPELEPFYRLASDEDLLRKLPEIQAIDGLLVLPKPIRYVTAECRQPDAFYAPDSGEVVMCYETMKVLQERGQQLAQEQGLDEGYPRRYLVANLRFILLHETGHALIQQLDIPVTGREEDAVDQLATTLMLRFAGADESPGEVAANLRMASNWFLVRSTGAYNLDAYADEHALGEQRYFNLQCLLYGSDPARFAGIVAEGSLTEARARLCPAESRRVGKAWMRLLLPYVAPKYEMTEEKATQALERRERERQRNSAATYVR